MKSVWLLLGVVGLLCITGCSCQDDDDIDEELPMVDPDIGASRDALRTDDEVVEREEQAIKLDGLSVAEMKELREKADKYVFQAEVNRMMKLIINSLYRNKEIFLRELISNASDALDKIRFMSLTDKSALEATEELSIRVKADKDNNVLHIIDTGIGMTKQDLEKNLGTIAKSGTIEFLENASSAGQGGTNDLIGQFGVGFYSSFLVADRVVVTSKHNDDEQYIWESDTASFSIAKDPRGNTLLRGTTISLFMKEEAQDFLSEDSLTGLIKKYSQFINFPIYLWESKTESVEEPIEEEEEEEDKPDDDSEASDDEDASVEEDTEKEDKPKTKTVEKTTWDWVLMNDSKPLWLRSPKEVDDEEYNQFFKSFSKETQNPLAKIHFTAEGEVTFKAILFIPSSGSQDMFTKYAKSSDKIKVYVRRVFITDDFDDMMPRYLGFVYGIVDSDDLPLNVSRETLQQHKLLKVIKKKLVRKALDMIKKMDEETYEKFWQEFSTNIKLGVVEDYPNKTRLAKLLRFKSSNDSSKLTSLDEYIERMRDKQDHIYYMAGISMEEASQSPFVERLLKKGYEVLYLTEPVDEYCMEALPEYEGKKFQNVAKEGIKFADEGDEHKEQLEQMQKDFEPLTNWLKDNALNTKIEKAVVSNLLTSSPCAIVAGQYGWSGNMERVMRAQAYAQSKDANTQFYLNQKKTLEINPRHPLMKELLKRVEDGNTDESTVDLAQVLYDTAVLRSGYDIGDSVSFASRIERMLRLGVGVDLDAPLEEEVFTSPDDESDDEVTDDDDDNDDDDDDETDDSEDDGDTVPADDVVKDEL